MRQGFLVLFGLLIVKNVAGRTKAEAAASKIEQKENWNVGIMTSSLKQGPDQKPLKSNTIMPQSDQFCAMLPNQITDHRPPLLSSTSQKMPILTQTEAFGMEKRKNGFSSQKEPVLDKSTLSPNWTIQAIVNLPKDGFSVWIDGRLLKSGSFSIGPLIITGVCANRMDGYWRSNPDSPFTAYVGETLPQSPPQQDRHNLQNPHTAHNHKELATLRSHQEGLRK